MAALISLPGTILQLGVEILSPNLVWPKVNSSSGLS